MFLDGCADVENTGMGNAYLVPSLFAIPERISETFETEANHGVGIQVCNCATVAEAENKIAPKVLPPGIHQDVQIRKTQLVACRRLEYSIDNAGTHNTKVHDSLKISTYRSRKRLTAVP